MPLLLRTSAIPPPYTIPPSALSKSASAAVNVLSFTPTWGPDGPVIRLDHLIAVGRVRRLRVGSSRSKSEKAPNPAPNLTQLWSLLSLELQTGTTQLALDSSVG